MSQFQQIFCYKVASLCIIHKNMRFIPHFWIDSLNKHIRNFKFIQILIKISVFTDHLTFAWFNDQSINIFLQKFLQTSGLFLSAVCCVFQDNTVTAFWKDIIHSLYQSRKNIIRNICGHYRNILWILYMAHILRAISTSSVKCLYISVLLQDSQCFTNCMSTQGIFLWKLVFWRKLLSRSDSSWHNITSELFHQWEIFRLSIICHVFFPPVFRIQLVRTYEQVVFYA